MSVTQRGTTSRTTPKNCVEVESVDVMAPLYMSNDAQWSSFRNDLRAAKSMGVKAVSTDVWWGLVEKNGDNVFDWSYYDKVVSAIKDAGLHWAPILSFHQCGGNVGDECYIPIPGWIWSKYPKVQPGDLQYLSEKDNYNGETVSLWEDGLVMNQYAEFMKAFAGHFGSPDVVAIIDEIDISMGPAGEMRYPSYNAHDGWTYPDRGFFQAYSAPARASFRNYVLNKYGNLQNVNKAWGTSLHDASRIGPPDDSSPSPLGRADGFVARGDYKNTQYGRDFIDWYNGSLVDHGRKMLQTAVNVFNGAFAGKEISMKTAGIHWQAMDNAPQPRIAEITAGLIRTSEDYGNSSEWHGYRNMMDMIKSFQAQRKVALYFTCLEMDNKEWDGGAHAYSNAKALVFWVAGAAAKDGVMIKGENALSGGVQSDYGWNNIENAFCYAPYSGLNVLRIANVTENGTGKYRYGCFIEHYAAH